MKNIKLILYTYVFYTISAFSISLSIKANVGVSSFNAMNLAISEAISIKVGTIAIAINMIFLLSYMTMTQFKFKSKYILQFASVMLFGFLINFFTYIVFKDILLIHYPFRILLIAFSTVISGISIGMIVSFGKITFPVESFCVSLSDKTSISFAKARYSVDIISVTISLILSLTYHLPFFVREGTLISLVLFSGSMSLTKNTYTNHFKKAA